ncbi:helix-turn-helix domain-containing protein [Microbacterium trichothecenolyticum]|uniref:Transcriptional regulator with XRE-family HTH domain n=1 Tax=Microbacterium trichothecenolyticum TaxID=69370 RepID=A0ABU0TYH6_MICTR|nr:helix-turn-helix domain-containing protein [Microbacterium trichothecenolyticum]MDQ1124706.1 transcriptional regulator with XRE-family HTH domain [Microbacterium trichothecenolyticum]
MKDDPIDDRPASTHVGGPASDIAAELRRLRLAAGSPTLTHLQHATGISRTVISDALRGRSLPSDRTIDALARTLGADPAPLLERRAELVRQHADGTAETNRTPRSSPRGMRRRTGALLAGGSFVAGVVATLAVVALVGQLTARDDGAPSIVVHSGENPANTRCLDDAVVATSDTRADDSLLQIVWSDKCQAGWGRITRYDATYLGNSVTIAIYPQTDPDGPLRQEATEHDVQGAFTTLLVRPSPDTLICADGSFTVDGTRIDLGDPLCI